MDLRWHNKSSWERFLELERKELARRREGALAGALGFTLPGEDPEELARLAREDRLRAEDGLVELRDWRRVWYKRLEDLVPEDRPGRVAAEMARIAWLRGRLERRPAHLRLKDERTKLTERAEGKLSRLIGRVRPGESQEELERIAEEDRRQAQQGMVRLKRGETILYKHIDDLTPEDRLARIEAERATRAWLAGRIGAQQAAAAWLEALRESGGEPPDARTFENPLLRPQANKGKRKA
jgi:hypothetical protein